MLPPLVKPTSLFSLTNIAQKLTYGKIEITIVSEIIPLESRSPRRRKGKEGTKVG